MLVHACSHAATWCMQGGLIIIQRAERRIAAATCLSGVEECEDLAGQKFGVLENDALQQASAGNGNKCRCAGWLQSGQRSDRGAGSMVWNGGCNRTGTR